MLTRLIQFILAAFIFICVLCGVTLFSEAASAAEALIPSSIANGATVPDFDTITFSNLPVLQEAGAIAVPDEAVGELGWNSSRVWEAGTPLAEVMQLGDVADAFGLGNFSLDACASYHQLYLRGG